MSQKIDFFFELMRGVYGASKFEAQWPDTKHEEAAKVLWSKRIELHTEAELRKALDHAQRMSADGLKDWQWPNIGLILSGARTGQGAHKPFLLPRDDTPEDIERRKIIGKKNVAKILEILNDKKEAVQESESDSDFGF